MPISPRFMGFQTETEVKTRDFCPSCGQPAFFAVPDSCSSIHGAGLMPVVKRILPGGSVGVGMWMATLLRTVRAIAGITTLRDPRR